MAFAKTELKTFLEDEVNKVKGVYYPVKAGFLRRQLIRSAGSGTEAADLRRLEAVGNKEMGRSTHTVWLPICFTSEYL